MSLNIVSEYISSGKRFSVSAKAVKRVLGFTLCSFLMIGDPSLLYAGSTNTASYSIDLNENDYRNQHSMRKGDIAFIHNDQAYFIGDKYLMPPDTVLEKWMKTPVDDLLANIPHTKIDDNNYQTEVLGANQPTMVLFYNNLGFNSSTGLATLVKNLSYKFPEIKLCLYKVSDDAETPYSKDYIKGKYPIKKTPALLWYDNDNGKMELFKPFTITGGYKTAKDLSQPFNIYNSNIQKFILDWHWYIFISKVYMILEWKNIRHFKF